MGKAKDREDFLVMLMANCQEKGPGEVLMAGRKIMRLAAKFHRLQELNGNQGLTVAEQLTEERTAKKIVETVKELNYKIHPTLGGDYRGYTVKLLLPGGQYNTWGGAEDGWGVPI